MKGIGDSTCDLKQCIKDIGCDNTLAEKFASGSLSERLVLLKKHRQALMDNMHDNQRKIDCVDYIINKIQEAKERANHE